MRWVGARINRKEDPKLLAGGGQFVGDMQRPNMLHCAILRSAVPHARVTSIDATQARELPGVRALVTSFDLEGRLNPIPVIWREQQQKNLHNPVVPTDRKSVV